MRILQYNVQSLFSNKNTVEYYINRNSFEFCIFSEIFAVDDSDASCRLLNYNTFCKPRADGYGGCAISVRKDIQASRVTFRTDLDILIVKTHNLRSNIVLISVYLFPCRRNGLSFSVCRSELERMFDFIDNFDNVIIAGDFNARSSCWGDYSDCPRVSL